MKIYPEEHRLVTCLRTPCRSLPLGWKISGNICTKPEGSRIESDLLAPLPFNYPHPLLQIVTPKKLIKILITPTNLQLRPAQISTKNPPNSWVHFARGDAAYMLQPHWVSVFCMHIASHALLRGHQHLDCALKNPSL